MEKERQIRLTASVTGTVQGVGFRYYTREEALRLGLTGVASNQADGSVLVVAEGPRSAVRGLAGWLDSAAAPGRVEGVDASYGEAAGEFADFRTE